MQNNVARDSVSEVQKNQNKSSLLMADPDDIQINAPIKEINENQFKAADSVDFYFDSDSDADSDDSDDSNSDSDDVADASADS